MKKLTMLYMVVLLSFTLTGCGKCEHEYDSGVIAKEATCTEEGEKIFICSICGETKIESVAQKEHDYNEEVKKESTYYEKGEKAFTCVWCGDSYVESIPVLDAKPYNQSIYEQMLQYYDDGDYINSLIVGKDTIRIEKEVRNRIDEIAKMIFESQNEYITEQVKNAFENKNYDIADAVFYYKKFGYNIGFNDDQLKEYKYVRDLQGEYFDVKDDNVRVEIRGYNLKIGDDEYILDYGTISQSYIWGEEYYSRLFFDNGAVKLINSGLIEITFENDMSIRCKNEEWDKSQEQKKEKERKEEERKKEEKRKKEQEYLDNEPRIGMTADEVKVTNWGEPNKINKTTYSWGVSEQWCYSQNRYIYLEDGIVTAISE